MEPFAGAASLFFAKEPSRIEVLNDLDGEIVNFMRCLQRRPWELVARLLFQPYSRAESAGTELPEDPVERAAAWYFLKGSSFGGRGPGHGFATGATSQSLAVNFRDHVSELLLHGFRLRDAILEATDFEEVIRRYDRPTTFFYCDPPYPDSTGYRNLEFTEEDHARLAEALRSTKGRALVNYHDHPLIRELYRGWKVLPFDARLYVNCRRKQLPKVQLLCITNYDPEEKGTE